MQRPRRTSLRDGAGALLAASRGRLRMSAAETAGPRRARKLSKLDDQTGFDRLLSVVTATARTGSGALNQKQREALDGTRRAFRIE